MMPSPRVILYGAGSGGRLFAGVLLGHGFKIVAYADKDNAKIGKYLDEVPIIPPADISANDCDYVIIASAPLFENAMLMKI